MAFRPEDTTPEAWTAQLEIWRRMGPEKRMAVALSMSEELVTLSRAGIRARHPEYDEEAVRLAEIRLRLGDALFGKAYPAARWWEP